MLKQGPLVLGTLSWARAHPLLALWFAAFSMWVATYLSLPTIGVLAERKAALSFGWIGLMHGAYGLALVLSRIPIGKLGNLVEQKILLTAGLLITTAGLLIVPLFFSPATLVVSRSFLGVGTGFWVIYTVAYVRHSPKSTGEAMAEVSLAYGAGITIAGLLGGLLVQLKGDFAPFWAGIGISTIGLIALIVGVREQPMPRSLQRIRLWRLLTRPQLLLVSMVAMLLFFAAFATIWGFSQNYAVHRFQASSLWLGVIAFSSLLSYALTMRASAKIRGRLGIVPAIGGGVALVSIGVLLIPISPSLYTLALLHGLMGVGLGMAYPILVSLSIEGGDIPEFRSEAMGMFQSIYALGIFLGPLASGKIIQAFGMTAMFVANGAVVLAALGIFLAFRRVLRG